MKYKFTMIKNTKTTQEETKRQFIEAYRRKERNRLFEEAKKPTLKVPMLQVNGVLMTPVEALRYLKLHLEAYQKARDKEQEVSMVCPTCGSVPHL